MHDGEHALTVLAIIEYLDEICRILHCCPAPAARARGARAQAVACEIHPLNNLRVLKYLTDVPVSAKRRSAVTTG
jgi:hypothetical protein